MSQEKPERINVRIPVLVSRTGEIVSGWFNRSANGECESDYDTTTDAFTDEAYKSGYVVVYVNAEIDEAGLFASHEVQGSVD